MRKMKGKIMAEEQARPNPEPTNPPQGEKHDGMTLTLGVLSIVSALIFPAIGIVLGVLGLVFSMKDRKTFGPSACKPGFVCSIVGLSLSGAICAIGALCVLASYQTMLI